MSFVNDCFAGVYFDYQILFEKKLFEIFGVVFHNNYFWLPLFWIPTICNFFCPGVIVRYLGIALKLTVIKIHGPLLEGGRPKYNLFKLMNRVSISNITCSRESNHYYKMDSISYNMIFASFSAQKKNPDHTSRLKVTSQSSKGISTL